MGGGERARHTPGRASDREAIERAADSILAAVQAGVVFNECNFSARGLRQWLESRKQ